MALTEARPWAKQQPPCFLAFSKSLHSFITFPSLISQFFGAVYFWQQLSAKKVNPGWFLAQCHSSSAESMATLWERTRSRGLSFPLALLTPTCNSLSPGCSKEWTVTVLKWRIKHENSSPSCEIGKCAALCVCDSLLSWPGRKQQHLTLLRRDHTLELCFAWRSVCRHWYMPLFATLVDRKKQKCITGLILAVVKYHKKF